VGDPTTTPSPPAPATPSPAPEPRQRWRLVFHRGPVPADQVGRAAIEGWQTALEASGLPLAQLDPAGRPRVAFGAPLQAAAEGESELAEIFLAERVPAWRVREGLAGLLPTGYTLLSAEDFWLGAPPLPGRVVAAEWRVELEASDVDSARLAAAAERLLAAPSLLRTRSKGGVDKAYDLRPLLGDIRVVDPDGPDDPITVRIRSRFQPELGSGRPEEVVAALGDAIGRELGARRVVRERLILAGDERSRAG
jgi:uncharacterized protein DUF2344